MIHKFNQPDQRKTVVLLFMETPRTESLLIEILDSTEHVDNYLSQRYPSEMNDAYCDLFVYGKHTFNDGSTYRIQHHQLNPYDND